MLFGILNIANNIKSLFFPEICLSCNNFLITGEKTICTSCRHHLPLTNFHEMKDNPARKIFYGRVQIESASAFLWFEKNSMVQQLIHALKYNGHQEIGTMLGEWYGSELSEITSYSKIDLVIPVPLHPKKMRKRKYNQVSGFGRSIANKLGATYVENILLQSKNTDSQTKKKRVDRWFDKKDSYTIKKGADFENQHIVLVDDILTTGATLEACIKTLQNYQNCKVSIITMAITA